ncbi:NnrU family protein [Stenotrophobium rhamnosiphilum]|uniref:NnrU protein n=1 Tax=Stenotrophobium rhamnosiphilum TaxID=2029166 RepID=A0A2T5MKY7_9GAMM|nr:NnrU family protein [Stenotrophobium rhamnosiphilum]PTU33241.1 NnrU protein [Stenotrophobium rhamnosiphilum]
MLVLGILLWAVTHLFVALAVDTRKQVIATIGLNPYKGLFSLTLVLSLVLIVIGWKAMPEGVLYSPPAGLRHLTTLLMPIAVILFLSARAPTDIKQIIRHPQLTSVKLWAVAHLLANGETRSVILFTGMLAWAVLEVIFINRRDGVWQKPAPVGATKTIISAVIGLVVTAVLIFTHRYFTGMPIISGGF